MSRESILRKEAEAEAEIALILGEPNLTYSFFLEHLRAFVMKKFALSASGLKETDNLDDLAKISVSKALKVSKDLVADYEAGENCEGATSSDVKRTLLLVKIQKSFDVHLSLQELMKVETVEDAAEAIWPHFASRQ